MTTPPMGEAEANGRFVEIIAHGNSADEAESRAHATLGLVGLCLGDQAIGEIVFSEPYETQDERQFGALRAGVTAKIPRTAQTEEKNALAEAISALLTEEKTARAICLALG